MNHSFMATYGDIGINAFAIISYLSSFTMLVFFGASEGMQPLFGQAYGAKEDDNLRYYHRTGQVISVVGSTLCVAIYIIFPYFLCLLFALLPCIVEIFENEDIIQEVGECFRYNYRMRGVLT